MTLGGLTASTWFERLPISIPTSPHPSTPPALHAQDPVTSLSSPREGHDRTTNHEGTRGGGFTPHSPQTDDFMGRPILVWTCFGPSDASKMSYSGYAERKRQPDISRMRAKSSQRRHKPRSLLYLQWTDLDSTENWTVEYVVVFFVPNSGKRFWGR